MVECVKQTFIQIRRINLFLITLLFRFRGFGGPQGLLICETWINHIADELGISAFEIRDLNMYKEGQITPFNQELDNWSVPRIWKQLIERGEYHQRRIIVDEFNSRNKWKKRGLSIIPTK